MTRFFILEKAATSKSGEFWLDRHTSAEWVNLCRSMCDDGYLAEVPYATRIDFEDWGYQITTKGRDYYEKNKIPAEW